MRTSLLDRLLALALVPILGPVVALLAWLVRRREGPPAFVGLARVGEGGRVFTMWKLRSMRAEAPDGSATGSAITGAADARITTTGAWLRRWRIDELPQLWNVLRGEM
ncbi:MAG: sugar transferase, partial [Acidimicrobiales bacterium]|nr:sugar transferase [Acidimicrobiales bacterium]